MSVGSNSVYDVKTEVLHDVTATGDFMAAQLNETRNNVEEVVEAHTGFDLTAEEIEAIASAENPARAINTVVSDRALIGWTTGAHTGTDLPIYAYGPQSDLFTGLLDNTDIPKHMAKAMKIKFGN